MPENLNSILIIIIFLIPGFICERAFSSSITRERRESTYIILESISLSCLYYGLVSWAIIPIFYYKLYEKPCLFAIILFPLLFVGPIITGILLAKIALSDKFQRFQSWFGVKIIHPIPKAWDYHFSQGISYLVVITLNDNTKIAGLFGPNSFASSFPSSEDIYLEAIIEIDENGKFNKIIENTMGALIERSNIKFIEFFEYYNYI